MKLSAILAALVAVFMMTGTTQAQHFNIGIKGGLNLYSLNSDIDNAYDVKPSFHIGLLGHIHITNHFAIQPEVVFSAQGTKYGDNLNLNLNYVNAPVLFQYMFDNGFRLQAGPQVGFLVAAKADGEDVNRNFKSIDFGMAVGASYVHPPSGFGIDARYNHGITTIAETENVDTYNRGFQVGVFYLFRHKS